MHLFALHMCRSLTMAKQGVSHGGLGVLAKHRKRQRLNSVLSTLRTLKTLVSINHIDHICIQLLVEYTYFSDRTLILSNTAVTMH